MDLTVSYIILPIFGLWCWRGIWILEDYYLWGYTMSMSDVHYSLWMGSVIFVVCVVLSRAIEISFRFRKTSLLLHVSSRLQNILLGVASVSFWRVGWYAWETLTGSSLISAWVSHLLGATGLIILGAFANVTFPPAVDMLTMSDSPSEGDEKDYGVDCRRVGFRWFGIRLKV